MVLVYDDGSTDGTKLKLKCMTRKNTNGELHIQYQSNLNRGKGFALKSLFRMALKTPASIIVTMDADGQHNPNDILGIAEPVMYEISDASIGINSTKNPFFRNIGIGFLNIIYGLGCTGGFRAYSREVIKNLKITQDGYGVDREILKQLNDNEYSISYVPISVKYDGNSHAKSIFRQFREIIKN
jgi:glycosyltransferase involved in cell wall biosynthesis